MSSSLPEGVSIRRATLDDAPAINELITAADVAVQGWSESSEGELRGWWRLLDLEQSSWVVHDDDQVAAYAVGFAHADMLELDGYVHPEQRGRGFGAWLVGRAEERARELGKQRLLAFSLAGDDRAHRMFEQFGMRELRRYYRMMLELEREPEPPQWPDGLRVSTFEPEDARAFHTALGEAFEDEWNFVSMPFEEWREMRLVKDPDFDPSLWFVVRDGDEIAAVMRNEPDRSGAGFVGALGVRKPWRRRGIAQALLQHAFTEFHRRGKRRVALGVDAENPTGATRLYERAGMYVAYEAVTYGKELAA
ncbi:MAG TPA: GNAT family N-acetyltransferase [Gaiellaceae bacterium]|nr:GNAT family N-acetyltransferase [Gaiellaceae bacterium]